MAMVHDFSVIKIGKPDWGEIKISIHDRFISQNMERLFTVDTFKGGFDKKPSKGLDYCGYTYIPPTSMDAFYDAVRGVHGLEKLSELCLKAKKENAWIEHHGL